MQHERDGEAGGGGRSRGLAIAALVLLVPAPTVGVVAGLYAAPGPAGQAVWAVSKLWLFGLPIAWHLLVQRRPMPRPAMTTRGLGMGLITGVAITAIIVGAYLVLGGRMIDPQVVRDRAAEAQLDRLGVYIGLVLYASFVNALLEEYVWRWFVFGQCETALGRAAGEADGTDRRGVSGRGVAAVGLAGLLFTLHHVVALAAYFDPLVTALCSVGVFIGGVTWSGLYLRYRSIWPGYVSHVLADLALFAVGAHLIFG